MAKHYQLTPSHSPALARKRWGGSTAFLTTNDYDWLISENATGTVGGKMKFMFLKGAFDVSAAEMFYSSLRDLEYGKSKRAAGTDALFGVYYDPRNGPPRFTNKTLEHRLFYDVMLVPLLLDWLSQTVRRKLPDYWKEQRKIARKNGRAVAYDRTQHNALLTKIAQGVGYKLSPETCVESDPIFSTVTINRSAPFLPHLDSKNEGGLSCLMAFGKFRGGDLCLPRLRVAFRLRPGDLLIADTKHEYHGNVDKIRGDRISVVGYLREMTR